MHFDVDFQAKDMALAADFDKVQTASDGGFERGYAAGYETGFSDGKVDGKVKVSTLPKFAGKPTDGEDEWFYDQIHFNGAWSSNAFIPFAGKTGATYLMSAKMKCETANNLGVCFICEDGSLVQSSRRPNTDWFGVAVASDPTKRVAYLGLLYGNGGSGYLKDWVVETMLEGDK